MTTSIQRKSQKQVLVKEVQPEETNFKRGVGGCDGLEG